MQITLNLLLYGIWWKKNPAEMSRTKGLEQAQQVYIKWTRVWLPVNY